VSLKAVVVHLSSPSVAVVVGEAAVLAYFAYCHFVCGDSMSCHHGYGMGGPAGKHCLYHGDGADAGVEPGQPIPQAPKK
jgi:hypothetical protein